MDFNVNVKVDLSDDAKAFLTGLIGTLRATTSTVGAVSQTVVETKPAATKPATKPAAKEPDTKAEEKAAAEAEEARQIAARQAAAKAKADADAAAKAKADADAKAQAEAAAKAEQEAAATEEPEVEDPLAPSAPAVVDEELTIQKVKEVLGNYRAIEGTEALMTLLGKYGVKDLPSLPKASWAAIVADAS